MAAAQSGSLHSMRFLLRSISFVLLALAVVVGVLDSIMSVAGSGVSIASLASLWARFSPDTLSASLDGAAQAPFGGFLRTGLDWVLMQPAFAVLLALSLAAWIGGYRRRPAAGRFAA